MSVVHGMLTELSVLVMILVITVLSLAAAAAAGRDWLERRRAASPPR